MDVRAGKGTGNGGGNISVADQAHPRTRLPDFLDQAFVAGAIHHDHHQLFNRAIQAFRQDF